MRKKRLCAWLLSLTLLFSLLPVSAAAAESDEELAVKEVSTEANSPIQIKKSVNDTGDKLTLEAYLTNEVTQTVSAKPLDIVLVLDQSGSMAYDFDGKTTTNNEARRQYAMKQAVNAFIEKAASADGTHNMAVVTFGTDATVLNKGWTRVDTKGAKALTSAINGLKDKPSGATDVAAGMAEAQKLMNSAQTGAGRQRVVIVFTDGVPTRPNFWGNATEFRTDVANEAIKAAKAMKDAGAAIYTVGIFNGAAPAQLHGDKWDYLAYDDVVCDGQVGSCWGGSWATDLFGNNDFASIDVPAGNRFLNYLSSNFSGVDKIGITKGTYDPGNTFAGIGSGTGWKIDENAQRTASNYYLTAKDSTSLNEVFQDIIQEISTLKIEAGDNTVLSDTLSEHFALNVPEGTDAANAITAEKWDCTGKNSDGSYTWKKADTQPKMTIEVTNKTIKVTGFDYTENAVTATTKEGVTTYSGAKLVVTIPIKPDTAYTNWMAGSNLYPTNDTGDHKAGLSNYTDKDGETLESTLLAESPEAEVTAYTVTYDWNMPDGVTAPSDGLPGAKYYIEGQNYTVDSNTYLDVLSNDGRVLCHFDGWTVSNTPPEDVRGSELTMGNQHAVLYAMWRTETAYTAVFDANGGAWSEAPGDYTLSPDKATATKAGLVADTKVTAPAAPVNGGKVFKGWGFTANAAEKDAVSGLDGEGTNVKTLCENAKVQNDTVTLYAIWGEAETEPEKTATVTFKIVGGTWEDGTDTDIKVSVPLNAAGDGTLLEKNIPTGMKAKPGYDQSTGTWDKTLVATVTGNAKYTYTFTEKDDEPTPDDWNLDVSKSKTATQLNTSTWTSNVTLSLPSATIQNTLDVVLVVDNAFPTDENTAAEQAAGLMAQLQEISADGHLKVNAGLVISGGYKPVLATVDLDDIATTEKDIADKLDKSKTDWKQQDGRKGSNIQAGIETARNMLNNETEASQENKYLILISDGGAFSWYDENGNTCSKFYSTSSKEERKDYRWCNPWDYQTRYGDGYGNNKPYDFSALMTKSEELVDANSISIPYDDSTTPANKSTWPSTNITGETQYQGAYAGTEIPAFAEFADSCAYDTINKDGYITTREAALYHAAKSIRAASAEANVIFVSFPYKSGRSGQQTNLFKLTEAFKEYVAADDNVTLYRVNGTEDEYPAGYETGTTEEVFSAIKDDLIYLVSAGSTVEDKIGSAFDFAGLKTMTLTVGGTPLERVIDGDTATFGDRTNPHRFTVTYNSQSDSFIWTINEDITKENPVQLTYTVELVDPKTAAGAYGVTDLNGDKIIDGTTHDTYRADAALYTNESAVLNPMDSTGNEGKSQEFPKPSVSYTVKGSDSHHDDDDDEDTYYFAIEKIDAQDSHTLNGAKFGLYLDGKQIATATSNRSGIATFRVYESDYRKITTKSDLYYQELTAPEGYVVSSDKIDIEKSDLTTSQTTAEKKAETVRNYRSSTPDLLNDDDHFAYVIGYKDGYVRPYGLISRAETTTIFFRLLKDTVRDGNLLTSNTYTDVPDNYWANTAISTMTGLGIVQGRSSTTFDPQAPITRAQFAAICARFDTGTSSGTQTFSDISGHWAEKYIQRAAELGWIKGFEDGTFRPDTYITRAQAMTMINRVLNRIPEETSDLLSNMNVWPDCTTNDWFYLAVQEATNSHDFKHKAGNYETWTGMNADPNWSRYEN